MTEVVEITGRLEGSREGFAYDDLLLRPRVSAVEPPDVSIATTVGALGLPTPFLSAAMESSGSHDLFIAVARSGGLAMVPQQWSLHDRLDAVDAVKGALAQEHAAVDENGHLRIAVACSASEVREAVKLADAGADVIVLESAHGGRMKVIEAAAQMRTDLSRRTILIAGNVVDAEAALRLRDAGVDGVKVGLGIGSVCTTTDATGVGVPQMSAIAEVADALAGSGTAVIADGGIRSAGDVVKSFAVGATAVCLGSLFAQSHEAAGDTRRADDGTLWRRYAANFYPSLAYERDGQTVAGEGLEGWVAVAGHVEEIVRRLSAATKAGMAYLGAARIIDVPGEARFIRQGVAAMVNKQRSPVEDVSPLCVRRLPAFSGGATRS